MMNQTIPQSGLRHSRAYFWLALSVVVIGLDAWTKYLANPARDVPAG